MEQKRPENFVGHPIRLADLADYQEGSVVSRTIIDKKAGALPSLPLRKGRASASIRRLLMPSSISLRAKQKSSFPASLSN